MIVDFVLCDLAKCLRACSHNLEVAAVKVVHVRTRVDLSKLPVGIERM